MADFLNWSFNEKRYRYSITDIDRRLRIINKKTQDGAEVVLNKLGKDIRHKVNTFNKEYYKNNKQGEYVRTKNRSGQNADIIHAAGYSVDTATDTLNVFYSPSSENGEYGSAQYRHINGGIINGTPAWGSHAGFFYLTYKRKKRRSSNVLNDRKKNNLSFDAYVDFIENGGEGWRNLGLYPKSRANPIPTRATERTNEWVQTKVNAVRNEVWQVAKTVINVNMKSGVNV